MSQQRRSRRNSCSVCECCGAMLDKVKKFLLLKVVNMKKPEAKVDDVGIKDVNQDGATYSAIVAVSNPYHTPIPISEISFTLKSADRVIISGKIENPGSLPGNGKTVLEVPVKVPHDILISLMRDIAGDWDIDYELDLDFTVHLPLYGLFTIPLSRKGQIKLPTLTAFF